MEPEGLKVLPLHKHPEYLRACCEMINEEWPRSETARMMSLQASCNELPTSLILVANTKSLLGHCKLTAIPSIPESCFVETVVISRAMRGKKLGTYLMRRVEEYCKSVLNLKMIHLSTKGQENFYVKLGYKVCAPISIYGVRLPSHSYSSAVSIKLDNPVAINPITQTVPGAFPPPPPPMPKILKNTDNTIKSNKTYMFKYL